MKDMTFQVKDNNTTKTYEIIAYLKNPNTNKTYIVYHENNSDEYFASVYTIEKGELILDEIKTDEEWDYIEEYLDNMEDENV